MMGYSVYGIGKCDNGICQVYKVQNLCSCAEPIIFCFYGQARENFGIHNARLNDKFLKNQGLKNKLDSLSTFSC